MKKQAADPLHPGAWLAWVLGAGAVAVMTTNLLYLATIVAAAAAVHGVHSRPEARSSFRIFARVAGATMIVRIGLLLFTPTQIDAASLSYAVGEGARLATVLILFGSFNTVVDHVQLLKMSPARWHEPSLAVSLALSIAPRTIAAARDVREAQLLRGIDVGPRRWLSGLVVPVLATGMDRALVLAESMDARGHGRGRRSRYRPQRWTKAATTIAVAGVFAPLLIVFLGAERTLTMPVLPELPAIHPAVLVACCLVATPMLLAPPGSHRAGV